MKHSIPAWAFVVAAVGSVQGAAPTIRSVDMFYKAGEYYRAYANAPAASYQLPSNTIKPPGENLLWDFSSGPTDVVYRFDYLDSAGVPEASDFPSAKVAERKTVEPAGGVAWLFFEPAAGAGRRVYGFYDPAFSSETPAGVFEPPIVDFPETIRYGQTWSTDMTFYSTYDFSFSDEEGEYVASFPVKLDYHSAFTADAWGTVFLPDGSSSLGLLDVLRVNERQAVDVSIDLAIDPAEQGVYTYMETDYLRNYYWLSPGHGIVAQINSTQGMVDPDNEFTTAAAYLRMFETNKEYEPADTSVKPVENLEVIISNGKVMIRWDEALNAMRYRLEYSTGGFGPGDWQALSGEIADRQFLDPAGVTSQIRFYRVVSLP